MIREAEHEAVKLTAILTAPSDVERLAAEQKKVSADCENVQSQLAACCTLVETERQGVADCKLRLEAEADTVAEARLERADVDVSTGNASACAELAAREAAHAAASRLRDKLAADLAAFAARSVSIRHEFRVARSLANALAIEQWRADNAEQVAVFLSVARGCGTFMALPVMSVDEVAVQRLVRDVAGECEQWRAT